MALVLFILFLGAIGVWSQAEGADALFALAVSGVLLVLMCVAAAYA